MFELMKAGRINKLSETHSENISDKLILMNIVSYPDAQRNLSKEEVSTFVQLYNKYGKTQEYSTNLLQYELRAFILAHRFEHEGNLRYADICGAATDILFMYSNRKPDFDEMVDGIHREFVEIINDIMQNIENLDFKRFICMSSFYMSSTMNQAIKAGNYDEADLYMLELVSRMFVDIVIEKLPDNDTGKVNIMNRCKAEINKVYMECLRNSQNTTDFIDSFTNSFMYLVGAETDRFGNRKLTDYMKRFIRK